MHGLDVKTPVVISNAVALCFNPARTLTHHRGNTMSENTDTAQQRFDRRYITSSEIVTRLTTSRPAIHFRRKAGLLPDAIAVHGNQLLIWERDAIEPHLVEWEKSLSERREKQNEA